MIAQTKRPDIETLIHLAAKKSEHLTITRTPEAWTVTGKDQDHAPVEYQSITDALTAFILKENSE